MDPLKADAALHRPAALGHISCAHCAEKTGRTLPLIQRNKENKNTEKREAGEENK